MEQSFEQFAHAHLPRLLRFAAVLTGERELAEDLVQDVLLKAHGRWSDIGELEHAEAYVRRMIINDWVSWRRKWARVIPRADIDDQRRAPDPADRVTERDALAHRLRQLPAKQRAVIVLRFYRALDDDQIAELLGCSAGTVRSHASRALAALRIDGADESKPALTVVREGL